MTAPKEIRRFSEQWLEMFDWFEQNPTKDLSIVAETEKAAEHVRFEFYRARSAIRRDSILNALYPNLERRMVMVRGATVIFCYRENSTLAELIKRGMQETTHATSEEARK